MTRYNTVIFGGTSGFGKQLVDLIEKESNSKIFIFGVNKPLKISKNIYFHKCDLASFTDLSKTLKFIIKKIKKVDVCIFNSGLSENDCTNKTKRSQRSRPKSAGDFLCCVEVLNTLAF